jgi:ankyrin repeat protein
MAEHLCANLHIASINGHSNCIIRLLNRGVHGNRNNNDGETVHLASYGVHKGHIIALLNDGAHGNGADVNQKDYYGQRTPLHYACMYGHNECILTLINGGADINLRNDIGQTPLHTASLYGRNGCIITLLNGGADINAKDILENTPLHVASIERNNECILTLLNEGADFNIKDNIGRTALDITTTSKEIIKQWIEENEIPIKEPSEN